jgi:DNA-binding winged helix-turn-helix (wHTH) protein|tara:strand:- start:1528 stop:1920 length:393 start_codon:yes stop_codon:yes gene_type:complete
MHSEYAFAGFTLNAASGALSFNRELKVTGGKICDFLVLLVSQPGEIVTKDQILDTLWPDQFVSEASISRLVSDTRQLLAQYAPETEFIQTIRGKGFKFVAPVKCVDANHQDDVAEAHKSGWWSLPRVLLL